MNNQTAYWLWIQQAIGYGSFKISYILDNYTFAEDFYNAPFSEKLRCGRFTHKEIDKLKDTSLEDVRKIMKRCKDCQIEIVNVGDVAYPKRLLNIGNPPAVLFVKGNKEILSDGLSVAMVGTRTATPYGMRTAFKLAFDLAKNGVTVISGGALGIDTYSHRGALQADGKTVCVLGCGIEFKYLRENDEMKRQMLRKGAIVSEYPPDFKASKYSFPKRNRIISGLSNGVLVVEAGKRSGSLITANLALEQGRDVFAVPGDISSDVSFGTNELIKDGAVPVTSASDIILYYGGTPAAKPKNSQRKKSPEKQSFRQLDIITDSEMCFENDDENEGFDKTDSKQIVSERAVPEKKNAKAKQNPKPKEEKKSKLSSLPKISEEEFCDLTANAQKILAVFDSDVLHIDKIAERSKLPIGVLHSAITQLEMCEYIESMEGRNYKILVSIK